MYRKLVSGKLFASLAFSFLCLLIIQLVFGFHYEEGTDVVWQSIISGKFNQQPERIFNTYGFHTLTSYAMAGLYSAYAQIEWYDVFSLAYLLLPLFFVFQLILNRPLQASENPTFKPWQLVGICLLALLPSLVLLQITRTIALGIFFLSAVLVERLSDDAERRSSQNGFRWIGLLRFSLLTVIALLLVAARIEPAALMAATCWGWILIDVEYSLTQKWRRMLRTAPIFIGLVAISLATNLAADDDDRKYAEMRPYQFALWDFPHDESRLKLNNRKDSVIYKAASQAFIADFEHVNPRFFDRIGLQQMDKTPIQLLGYFIDPVQKIQGGFSVLWSSVKRIPAMWLFSFTAFLFLVLISPSEQRQRIVLFQAYILTILFLLAAFMKLEDRIVEPILAAAVIYQFLVIGRRRNQLFNRPQSLALIGLLLILPAGFLTANVIDRWSERVKAAKCIDVMHEIIDEQHKPKNLIYDLWSFDRSHIKLFEEPEMNASIRRIALDNGVLCFYSSFQSYLQQLGAGDTYREQLEFFSDEDENSLFILASNRINLHQEYIDQVLEMNAEFVPVDDSELFCQQVGPQFGLYRLKKH